MNALHSSLSAGPYEAVEGCPAMDPKDYIKQAEQAEEAAAVVSFGPDKQRLTEMARQLRALAAQHQSEPPTDQSGDQDDGSPGGG